MNGARRAVPAQSALINFENNFVANGERDGERESKGWMGGGRRLTERGGQRERRGRQKGRENNFVPKFP